MRDQCGKKDPDIPQDHGGGIPLGEEEKEVVNIGSGTENCAGGWQLATIARGFAQRSALLDLCIALSSSLAKLSCL